MTLETKILSRLKEYGGRAIRAELEMVEPTFSEWRRALQNLLDDGLIERHQEQHFNPAKGGVCMWIGYRITEKGAEQ